VSAAHSGLAEVGDAAGPRRAREVGRWLSFGSTIAPSRRWQRWVADWLQADPTLRARTRAGLVAAVREHWSWEGVARGVIAAARGELDALARPGEPGGPAGQPAARSVG
jgi:hypothetical protein